MLTALRLWRYSTLVEPGCYGAMWMQHLQGFGLGYSTLVELGRGGEILSFSAIRTRSASEAAFILRITQPRCALMVNSVIPSSPAICLFKRPATTSART